MRQLTRIICCTTAVVALTACGSQPASTSGSQTASTTGSHTAPTSGSQPSVFPLTITRTGGIAAAGQQNIALIFSKQSERRLKRTLKNFVRSLERPSGTPAEGIDPCHSLIGNLNQFSAAEILQMSCLSQRSGRFTFKSGRGNSEIYLQHGSIRHALFGSLEGEAAVAEIFRWRQGRFYFEEGIISQVQTVDRPWAHLLIDNLQKLDETLELVSLQS